MTNDFLIKSGYTPVIGTTPINRKAFNTQAEQSETNVSFKQMLEEKRNELENGLVFSKHALQRINDRNINLTDSLINQVSQAVEKAEQKGVKDALILGNGTAFIVNVPSKTVVTTINGNEMKDSIITNIDGTVIL